MTLGRVRRERIGRLDPGDWEFVQRLGAEGQPLWGRRYDTAQSIFRAPGRTSMTGRHYIAPLGLYILPQRYGDHLIRGQLADALGLDSPRHRRAWPGSYTLLALES
jgi:hypothetical protein